MDVTTLDHRIHKILRDHCDVPRVLFITEEPILLPRHGTRKHVLLASTKFYTYLIKKKGYHLYYRWSNRTLLVEARQKKIMLSSTISKSSTTNGAARDSRVVSDAGASKATDEDDFSQVTLEANSSFDANAISDKINLLVRNAQRMGALLELEEIGTASRTSWEIGGKRTTDDEGADGDSESSGSEADDVALAVVPRTVNETKKTYTNSSALITGEDGQGLLQIAPSRYISVMSLVDGEFVDYTTLKNAYLRHEDESLLNDLSVFIKQNERQVEVLCEHHYPALINVAQKCLTISEKDAQRVGEELSGSTALVRSAVVNIKQAASNLLQCQSSRDNLISVRDLLRKSIAVVEYLETVETQLQKQQLIGTLGSLRELVRLAAPMAESTLGEYVLQIRVPAIMQAVFTYAIQHLNVWLKLLNDQASLVGGAAFSWGGCITAGSFTKKIVFFPQENKWGLTENYQNASMVSETFDQGEAIAKIVSGASIQSVFHELRRGDYFCKYYTDGRAQQARASILEFHLAVENTPGEELVKNFTTYCATALGFMLIEDVVWHATAPSPLSSSEVLKMWDRVASAIADRVWTVSRTLSTDPSYSERMVEVFNILRRLIQISSATVKCVELNSLVLFRVVESITDQLTSSWLQDACLEGSQIILMDSLTPLTVSDASQFESYVSRFYLNTCSSLELPVPKTYTSGLLKLPYSLLVPSIGNVALKFISQCYSVVVVDPFSSIRQSELNNVDEMLLKYISVLFRTVAEFLLQRIMTIHSRSVLEFATLVSSCAAIPVLVSCVEQEFMLHWAGGDSQNEEQTMGSPQLLAECAAFFSTPLQKGIEMLLGAFIAEVEDRLKPTFSYTYWKTQLKGHTRFQLKDGTVTDEGFAAAMEYIFRLIPQLNEILQYTVARSVCGTTVSHAILRMQSSIQDALKNAYEGDERDFAQMRECVKEFDTQCTLLIPLWQKRLSEVMPELPAAKHFPLQLSSAVSDLNNWIDVKEAENAAERVVHPNFLASLEVTSRVVKGFKAMGSTVTARASVFSKRD
ncbi:unnamed protein product [Phytomonas sp. EM1]|nr:unnamed protein product [Phytomonas sp. EM1]|eukprot:CCW60454.1 unnamed protein product [Phytomonas sp. isolate EM1]